MEQKSRALPYLTFWLNYKLFGISSPAFHATNLALHLVTALAVLYCADAFLRELGGLSESGQSSRLPSVFAVAAALIFVVHPLTVEVTHYTRARDHGLVGLFAFLAAYGALRFLKGRLVWIFFLAPVIFLAAVSKEPGLPHAVLAIFLVAVFGSKREDWRRVISNRFTIVTCVVLCILAVIFYSSLLSPLVSALLKQTDDSRFGWHLLTQARVFWGYLQLMVLPTTLCADHLVAWTRSTKDVTAWIGIGGIGVAMIGTLVLWRKGYLIVALFLALLASGDTDKAFSYFQIFRDPLSVTPDSRIAGKLDQYGISRALLDKPTDTEFSPEMIEEMKSIGLPEAIIFKP
jgi:hypothetical protein